MSSRGLPVKRPELANVSTSVKPAKVRFYFDADILGLGKLISSLRYDCTYPGDLGGEIHKRKRSECVVKSADAPDAVWIPSVAEQKLLIITRDRMIRYRDAELNVILENNARVVLLIGKKARTKWEQLEIVMTQWRKIEGLYDAPGPFIYKASRTALSKINI